MAREKYVLNTITKRLYVYEKQSGNLVDFYRGMHESDKTFIIYADDLSDYYKLSDNILDLVEVGDLIETARDGVVEIIGENFYVRTSVYIYSIDITAIYKRQLNGDYKKYEVRA